MQNKFSFIEGVDLDPVPIIKTKQTEYSEIVKNLDRHFELRGELTSKWNSLLNFPEFTVIFEDETHKIKCESDRTIIASITNKDLAENIVELMNLAHREGAKQIIQILKGM